MMEREKKLLVYNVFALLFGVWFMLLGWAWVYYFNLLFVFPFALAGFFLWRMGRHQKSLLSKIAGATLLAGLISSLASLVILLLKN